MGEIMRRSNPWVATVFFIAIFLLYTPLFYLVLQTFLNNPQDLNSGFTLRWLLKLFHSPALWEPLMTSLEIGVLSASLAVTVGKIGRAHV